MQAGCPYKYLVLLGSLDCLLTAAEHTPVCCWWCCTAGLKAVNAQLSSATVARDSYRRQVSCKPLPFCCASTVVLSKTVPFRAVCPTSGRPGPAAASSTRPRW
eukprot:SAG22_NODE_1289_length_4854_cov_2.059937_4_plen_103_part_00